MTASASVTFSTGFDEGSLKRALPSWLISLLLHGLMLLTMMFGLQRSGLPDGDSNSNEPFREAGLVLKADFQRSGIDGPGDTELPQESTQDQEMEDRGAANLISEPAEIETAEVTRPLLDLPSTSTLGATRQLPLDLPQGTGKRPTFPNRTPGTIKSRGAAGGGGRVAGQGTPNGTSFLQIAAQGDHFCYIIDCSSSMEGPAMALAKAELAASIERLDSAKQFQIFFYNSEVHTMTKDGKQNLFYATEINRTFARQFINNQVPDQSTMHMPALIKGLKQGPDVIFFLTDGEDPELYADDLKEIQKQNRANTQIHVIQFGKGAKLGPTNWLERLAEQNGGTFRYRDLERLRRE